ncbi:ribonuclease P protein component [Shimia thalassica]|uniref:ribonuclease P protein component n=1 Tax=Shimia thalassica TaxID=1715693 RepID=UPI001C0A28F0|nr:ribonuclease P protein component [Shimia thalassica]MBU2943564.1 ribonuclease P protein component [Shimia thalassica]MDO6501634.1 ribonuclease P protein component [Shimia thalassica]
MTPPEAPEDGTATQGIKPPAVSVCLEVLKNRSEFLAASRARKQGTKAMMVQARKRRSDEAADPDAIRVGFTCSKKVGNAVARNRAKRRLREVARAVLPVKGKPGWDYVLIGRATETSVRPFEVLKGDLMYALKKLHTDRP